MNNNCTIIKMIPKNNIYGHEISHGFSSFKHWQQEIEFVYSHKGFIEVEVDNCIFNIQESEMLIISSGALHNFLASDDNSIIYVVRLPVDDIASNPVLKEEVVEFFRETMMVSEDKIIKNIISSIIFADLARYNEYYSSIKGAELTIHLINNQNLIKKRITPATVDESETIVKMQLFIEENLHNSITLTMLADYLSFSNSYCSKFIKKKTNLNFLEYVKTIRLREAEEFLRTTDMSITDIAYSTGFPSIQSFNRIFKSSKGTNPTGYRKSLKNK
ncbi:MAG TPA: helix-turn-helix transcriptional regulator [Clostridiales bacterium]|nr:helix-turn-helix transcriptional regulator [Clostridiales bacterium]